MTTHAPHSGSRNKKRVKNLPRKQKDAQRPQDRFLFGLHTVEAALKNPDRKLTCLRSTKNALSKLQAFAGDIPVEIMEPRELDRLIGAEVVHQGVILEAEPLPTLELSQLTGQSPVLLLDQVTDPHNVGAIIRTAAAFNIAALVMTARNSPPLSGVMAKTASGGLEHVPICLVSNLSRALTELGEMGYWRLGLDGEGESCIEEFDHNAPVALILGAEGKGLRRLTKENCDQIVRIKTATTLTSLNVSNAAAIALHSVFLGTNR